MHCRIITAYARNAHGVVACAYVEESNFPGLPPGTTYRVVSERAFGTDPEECIGRAVDTLATSPRWKEHNPPVMHRGRKAWDAVCGACF